MVTAEIREPVVVDAEHLTRRLVVTEARGGAEDAEDHLDLDAVHLRVLEPEVGIDDAPDAPLGVLVEARRRHLVDAVVLSRYVLLTRRPDAADEAERLAVLAGPVRTVRAVGDERHPVTHRHRSVRGEQVGREPGHVDVAVGRDPRVFHVSPRMLVMAHTRRVHGPRYSAPA